MREAGLILSGLGRKSTVFKKLDTYIAPPEVYFESVSRRANGYARLAMQGLPLVPSGIHTGKVSVETIRNFGVRLSILGHSEERILGETSENVSKKVRLALKSGIKPLVCIGESEHDSDGEHLEFIRRELKSSLDGIKKKEARGVMIAYEPIWAIGKRAKDAMKPEGLAEMLLFIRRVLSDMYGREVAEKVKILYGGSVEPDNARELIETGIDGLLVGHVSLEPKKFAEIAESLINKKQ